MLQELYYYISGRYDYLVCQDCKIIDNLHLILDYVCYNEKLYCVFIGVWRYLATLKYDEISRWVKSCLAISPISCLISWHKRLVTPLCFYNYIILMLITFAASGPNRHTNYSLYLMNNRANSLSQRSLKLPPTHWQNSVRLISFISQRNVQAIVT